MFKKFIRWFLKDFITSWQAIAWVALVFLIIKVSDGTLNLKGIKAAGFEIDFAENAQKLNVYNTDAFRAVKGLNENELKLFLIMGGEEAKYYTFSDKSLKFEASVDMYKRLQKDSLIRYTTNYRDTTFISPTEVGSKVHKALVKSLYNQLND